MTVVKDKQANLADPREIKITFFSNPTTSDLVGYRTQLDGADVVEKLTPGSDPDLIRVANPADGIIRARWQEDYGTDAGDCKIWVKVSPDGSNAAPLIIYDTIPGDDEDASDDDHKIDVTDVTGQKGNVVHTLFAGASTPDGYESESAAGEYFNNAFPVGTKAGIVANDDESAPEISLKSSPAAGAKLSIGHPILGLVYNDHEHTIGTIEADAADGTPPYHELKVIRSNKIKAFVPKDAIIIFDAALPSGFTRYTAADGKYIRGGGTVGATGGATQRKFYVHGTTGSGGSSRNKFTCPAEPNGYDVIGPDTSPHSHTFGADSDYIDNDPPFIEVVLGKADDDISYIPAGAIMMFDEQPPATDWETLDWEGKLLIGAATYGSTGGNETETVSDLTAYTNHTGCVDQAYGGAYYWGCHRHLLTIEFEPVTTYPECRPVIFAKAKHNITEDGPSACVVKHSIKQLSGDVWYSLYSDCGRHIAVRNNGEDAGELICCFAADGGAGKDLAYYGKSLDGGKTWTVSRLDDTINCTQIMTDMVVDKNNNVHFVWAEMDDDPNHSQIKYRRLNSDDTWESVETVSTAGPPNYQADPCIQVKNDGESVGVAWVGYGWGTDEYALNIAYRERSTVGWGSEERITTDAAGAIYYRAPTIDYDSDDYPHMVANYGNQSAWNLQNVYYWQKTSGGWQTPEKVNNDAGQDNLAPNNSNVLIDDDDNIHIAYAVSTADGPLHAYYKKKARGGAWPASELVASGGAETKQYMALQIQSGSDGKIYCCHTAFNETLQSYEIAYHIREDTWGTENIIRSTAGRFYSNVQMLWSRLPISYGIYQSLSNQYAIFIYVSGATTEPEVGNIEFYANPETVIGDIYEEVTKETYVTKRRGAICKSKVNGPLASPALIS
ncbi:MAG: hypothetical protein M0R06_00695 [Sphaerochaeta sp.]|jgi:hypothetical protein|nr:hypothetical protein [Sphaerochaeta sp.]